MQINGGILQKNRITISSRDPNEGAKWKIRGHFAKYQIAKYHFLYIFRPEELENKWFRKNCKCSTQLLHRNNAFEAYWIGKIRAVELYIACVLLLKKSATSREAEMHWYFDISHDSWPWPWTTKNCAYAELILSKFFMYNLSINHHPFEHITNLMTCFWGANSADHTFATPTEAAISSKSSCCSIVAQDCRCFDDKWNR